MKSSWVVVVLRAFFFVGCSYFVVGCNWVTGADDLIATDEWEDPNGGANSSSGQPPDDTGSSSSTGGPSSSSTGSSSTSSSTSGSSTSSSSTSGTGGGGGASSSGSSSSSSSSGNGGSGGAPPVGNAADGVTITDVQLYQAIEVPVMNASTDIPIVAGKDAMVRVFYQTSGGYDGQPVTGRFSAGQDYAEATKSLSGSSSQSSLSSTINIEVPGKLITVGGTFRIDLVQPNGSGSNSAAGYPQGTQQTALNAQSSGTKLKVMLVPVNYYNSLPDTSPGQVQKYADWIRWQYPVPEVEVTVRSQPHSFNSNLGSYYGWSQLLDEITNLRNNDNAASDVYYYGIHDASGSGLLGLGWVGGQNDVWSRTAIGVGWTGETAPETAVHEIGHNHGRDHAPCGVSGDPYYPYSGASIGVWGYHPQKKKLLSPNDYVDFMSYCSPTWVSDYTYKALFKRLKHINGAKIFVPPELLNRSWSRIKILDGQAYWLSALTMKQPPVGQETTVVVQTASGTQQLTGHYYAYNHIDGGVLYILQPKKINLLNAIQMASFSLEGQSFVLPH